MKCIDLDNYALTGCFSRYNEDSLTAQQLFIKTAKKCKECVNTIDGLRKSIENAYIINSSTIDPSTEEVIVEVRLYLKIASYRTYSKYYFLFNEDSKTFIELSADINKAINECLTELSNLINKIKELGIDSTELAALNTSIDSSYVEIYDDCSFNILELSGRTAKNVNCLIDIINNFENNLDLTASITYSDDESLALNTSVADEILTI